MGVAGAQATDSEARPIGRPSTYTPEMANRICEALTEGRTLRSLIASDEGIPGFGTIFRWLEAHADFREQYTRARAVQADVLADEIMDVGRRHDDPQAARVRVDALKWAASKIAPKKYGERVSHELTGGDGGPVQLAAVPLTAEQTARVREIGHKALLGAGPSDSPTESDGDS